MADSNVLTDLIGKEGVKVDFKLSIDTQDIILIALSVFGAVFVSMLIIKLIFPNK